MKLREYKIARDYFFCYEISYTSNEKYKRVFKFQKICDFTRILILCIYQLLGIDSVYTHLRKTDPVHEEILIIFQIFTSKPSLTRDYFSQI